jgi:propionyl-CoA carboxylase beta chain
MGPEGAANIIFAKEIKAAEDPEKVRQTKIDEYRQEFANPYRAGSFGYVQDVIEPSQSRLVLISAFEMLATKHVQGPAKKHGNIPL